MMESLEKLEENIRKYGIDIIPVKQIVDIKLGTKKIDAWNELIEIGKTISNNWKLKNTSWKIISENRR